MLHDTPDDFLRLLASPTNMCVWMLLMFSATSKHYMAICQKRRDRLLKLISLRVVTIARSFRVDITGTLFNKPVLDILVAAIDAGEFPSFGHIVFGTTHNYSKEFPYNSVDIVKDGCDTEQWLGRGKWLEEMICYIPTRIAHNIRWIDIGTNVMSDEQIKRFVCSSHIQEKLVKMSYFMIEFDRQSANDDVFISHNGWNSFGVALSKGAFPNLEEIHLNCRRGVDVLKNAARRRKLRLVHTDGVGLGDCIQCDGIGIYCGGDDCYMCEGGWEVDWSGFEGFELL
jgi:hypothetical protein